MDAGAGKKAYVVAIVVQLISTGMYVVSKAAFNQGMNTFVFIFYRQLAATLLLLPFALVLERKNARSMLSSRLLLKLFLQALLWTAFSLGMYISLKFTSATVASAASNSTPALTFFVALLLRMEVVKLRSPSGMAKLAGVALCVAGALAIALYLGPSLNPVNHHRAFAAAHAEAHATTSRGTWIKGTFLALFTCMVWSVWIVMQAALLREFPNKMLVTAAQCVFSALQSFLVAVMAERDFSRWQLRLDISLLAVVYTGFVVTGVAYYLQAWCVEMKGPVFLAAWTPLCFVFTILCSSSFLGEVVHLGSIVGGILLVGGLYSVLWGKSKEARTAAPCGGEAKTVDDGEEDEQQKKPADDDELDGKASAALQPAEQV